jgi:osmoprotectant transport system ATP-binding protein
MIEFRDASYEVGGRRILSSFNLTIGRGETLVLLGRSGSGKSTALKLINGLLMPTSGEVRVSGKSTADWDPVRLKRGIGYVIQQVGLFPHLSVYRNISVVPEIEGWQAERIQTRVSKLLTDVGLPETDYGSRYPRQLSGGQQQRVGVARALAIDPPILLFDEPFGALDPVTRMDLQNQFLALTISSGKTSLFVTHDLREALRLGTRIALINEGRVDVAAPPEEFLRSTTLAAREFLACL